MKAEIVKTVIEENPKKNGFHQNKNGFANGHANGKTFPNGDISGDCSKKRDQVSKRIRISP
jgi:hypothetical protein